MLNDVFIALLVTFEPELCRYRESFNKTGLDLDNASVVLLNILKGKYGEVSEITPSATHLGIKWETLPTGDIKISQPGYILRKF